MLSWLRCFIFGHDERARVEFVENSQGGRDIRYYTDCRDCRKRLS